MTAHQSPVRKRNLAGVWPTTQDARERLKAFMQRAEIIGYRHGNEFVFYRRGERGKNELSIETPRTSDDWLTSFYHAAVYAAVHDRSQGDVVRFARSLGMDPESAVGYAAARYATQVARELREFLGARRYAQVTALVLDADASEPAAAAVRLHFTPSSRIVAHVAADDARAMLHLRRGFREGAFRASKGKPGTLVFHRHAPLDGMGREGMVAVAHEIVRELQAAGVPATVTVDWRAK